MKKIIWALLDNRMGSVGQARGILQSLGDDFEIVEKNIVYNRLASLPNCLLGASFCGVNSKKSSVLQPPYPDAVLSISRRTTPIARRIKKLSQNKTKIIQLIYPGKCGLQDLDLVIVPEHDRKNNPPKNIFYITGCPHRITPQNMAEAKLKWEPSFEHLPRPWYCVAVGGAIKKKTFTVDNAVMLGREIRQLINKTGGSLLITTSRRTGDEAQTALMKELQDIPAYTYLWGEKKDNPIMGFWACADKIIVTGDSVSMCCEACGAGKPVIIFCGKNWLTPKHQRFVQSLYNGKYAVSIEDALCLDFVPEKTLNPCSDVIEKIRRLF